MIELAPFLGWPNSYHLSNAFLEARVVTDVGPRIMDLRPRGGPGLLLPLKALGGQGEAKYKVRGGWRLWIAPERKETTYALDNSACTAQILDETTLRVTAKPQPEAGVQKQIEVSLGPRERRLRIRSSIRNVADRPLTLAAWSVPILRPGGRAFLPLDAGPRTALDDVRRIILWSYARPDDPRYRFSDQLIEIDHTRVRPPRSRRVRRRDDESKIGCDSTQGWAAYLFGTTLLIKRFPHQAGATYPDGGSTLEVYSNHELLELEHLGPLTTIAPGQKIVSKEDWWLFTDVRIPRSAARSSLARYLARTEALLQTA